MRGTLPLVSSRAGCWWLIAGVLSACAPADSPPLTPTTDGDTHDVTMLSVSDSENATGTVSDEDCVPPPAYADDFVRDIAFTPSFRQRIEHVAVDRLAVAVCGEGFVGRIADATLGAASIPIQAEFAGTCAAIAMQGTALIAVDPFARASRYEIAGDGTLALREAGFAMIPATQPGADALTSELDVHAAHLDQGVLLVAAGPVGTLFARYAGGSFEALARRTASSGDAIGVQPFDHERVALAGDHGFTLEKVNEIEDQPPRTSLHPEYGASGLAITEVEMKSGARRLAIWAGTRGIDNYRVLDTGGGLQAFLQNHIAVEDTDVQGIVRVDDHDIVVEASRIVRSSEVAGERRLHSIEELSSHEGVDEWFGALGHLTDGSMVVATGNSLARYQVLPDVAAPHLVPFTGVATVVKNGDEDTPGTIALANHGDAPLVLTGLELPETSSFRAVIVNTPDDPTCPNRYVVGPLQTARILVTYVGLPGKAASDELTLLSNDPDQPKVHFKIQANLPTLHQLVGQVLPDFTLPIDRAGVFSLASARGRYVAIEFINENIDAKLTATAKRMGTWMTLYGADKVQPLLIYSGRSASTALDSIGVWLQAVPGRSVVPLLFDPLQHVISHFWRRQGGAPTYPVRALLDPNGVVIYVDENEQLDDMDAEVERRLKPPLGVVPAPVGSALGG